MLLSRRSLLTSKRFPSYLHVNTLYFTSRSTPEAAAASQAMVGKSMEGGRSTSTQTRQHCSRPARAPPQDRRPRAVASPAPVSKCSPLPPEETCSKEGEDNHDANGDAAGLVEGLVMKAGALSLEGGRRTGGAVDAASAAKDERDAAAIIASYDSVVQQFLPNFSLHKDLGYYSFSANGDVCKQLDSVVALDITNRILTNVSPPSLADLQVVNQTILPTTFMKEKSKSKHQHMNLFPYDPSYLTSLYVATKVIDNKVALEDIDFVFGGSTLTMLDTRKTSRREVFLVERYKQTVLVKKHKVYNHNPSDKGFQFERLVTGGTFGVPEEGLDEIVEHLQVVHVGEHRILFSAETDAVVKSSSSVDGGGDGGDGFSLGVGGVEIKCSDPRKWKRNVALQMVSSGSLNLVHGNTIPGRNQYSPSTLSSIGFMSLADVFLHGGDEERWKDVSDRMAEGLNELAAASVDLPEGKVFEVLFSPGLTLVEVKMRDDPDARVLPRLSIVRELLD
jgi:hypothetical protein